MWGRFTAFSINGSIFFGEISVDTFLTVSVTCENNAALLKSKIIPHLQEKKAHHSIMFMQDGVPLHIDAPVMTILKLIFRENCVLSH